MRNQNLTVVMGNHKYTAHWGTYTHRKLGNFQTQLSIGELTHTGNWGTFKHSCQLGNLHTPGTEELSYTVRLAECEPNVIMNYNEVSIHHN